MLRPREFYNQTYEIYDIRHKSPYTQIVRQKEKWLLKKYAKGLILDFGCGTGFHLAFLDNVIGYDVSQKMLKIAKPKEKPLLLGDEHIPLKDKCIDTVICFLTVLNMCDYSFVIKEFFRILKNDGIVILSLASIYDNKGLKWKTIQIHKTKMRIRLFTKSEIINEFRKNGFKLVYFDSVFRGIKPEWGNLAPLSISKKIKLFTDFIRPKEKGSMYFFVFKKL